MAVNPNFTNANPFTPYGGGSNFPLGVGIGGGTAIIGNGTSMLIQPATEIFLGDGAGSTARYNISSISYVNPIAGSSQFLNLQNTGAGVPNFVLNNVSTLTFSETGVAGSNINLTALASTLKSVYPACVG
jgi:hypothetical protein